MSVIEDIKSIGNVLQKAGNIEVYSKIINIQTVIMDLQEQNNTLRKELLDIKSLNDIDENLIFENNMYFIYKDNRSVREGPYCTRCWDENRKLVRLHSEDVDFRCPVCNTYIDTDPHDTDFVIENNSGW